MKKKNTIDNEELISVIREIAAKLEGVESALDEELDEELFEEDSTKDLCECEKLRLITDRATTYSEMDPVEKACVDYFDRARDSERLRLIQESMERIEKTLEQIACKNTETKETKEEVASKEHQRTKNPYTEH